MRTRDFFSPLTQQLPKRRRSRAAVALVCLLALTSVSVGVLACASHPAPQVEEVRTTLTTTGFDPPEARRAPGRVRLTVVNQSGQQARTLRLKRLGSSEVIHEGQMAAGAGEWSEEFDLGVGKYVLSEANNPAWLFYLVVEG